MYLIGGTGTTKVFDMNEVVNDIDCAQNQWACICGKENEPCECHINLIWSKRNNDFPNPRSNLAMAHCVCVRGLCCIACNEYNTTKHAYICLNNTNSFIDKVNGIQSKAFVNKDVVYPAEGGMCKALNLCDVLTHELGHIYGIDYYDEFHCNSSSSLAEPTTGIMNSTIDANTPYRGLSNDDKCMFAWLYCSSVEVEDGASLLSNIQVKTYPAPAQNVLNIEFILNESVVDLIFQVFSENGKVVYENNYFYHDVGHNKISEDFSFLNNGTYFYKLKNDRNEFIRGKFIIAR